MKSKIRNIVLFLSVLLMAAFAATAGASAATTHRPHPRPQPSPTAAPAPVSAASVGPAVPAGYTLKYSRNFAHTAGLGDWVVQPGAGATVRDSTTPGAEFGAGVEMTQLNQWAELISSDAVVTQNTFVQGLIYVPGAAGTRPAPDAATFPAGSTANWPAFWTFGNPWPQNGEIDAMEAQSGRSCFQNHYGTSGEINTASDCGSLGAESTGWITVSFLRTGGQVTAWYGNTKLGTLALPTTADEKLVFQNQSYSTSVCGHCFGPTVLGAASTAWLSNVQVYSK